MINYSSGAIVGSRYVLVDNLTRAGSSDAQVWSALDNKTGKKVVGNFYKDGSVEWIDNEENSNFFYKLPLFFSKSKVDIRVVSGSVAIILALFFGYQYQNKLSYLFSNGSTYSSDRSSKEALVSPVNWQESAVELDGIEEKTGEDKTSFFTKSAQNFDQLRQSSVSSSLIDSLYKIYLTRGNSAINTYQQQGGQEFKIYALNWLNLAFVLRPSLPLEEYINRLGGKAMEQLPVPVVVKNEVVENEEVKTEQKVERKPKSRKKMSELFLKDPELQ